MKNQKLKNISVVAVFCAIAFLLTFFFKFKVSFLTFDFKDAIIAIISLVYGPLYGVTSAGLVSFLEFLSVSDTGIYGLIAVFTMLAIKSGTLMFSGLPLVALIILAIYTIGGMLVGKTTAFEHISGFAGGLLFGLILVET